MFTVNIKGKRYPKNIEFVKLEMVFYKRGFARVTKVLYLTGLYKDWDQKTQLFSGKESAEKNKFLRQEKLKYLKVAERWESRGKDWIPVELSHYYDIDPKFRNKYIPISGVIEELAEKFTHQERYKKRKNTLQSFDSQKISLPK